MRIEVRTAAEVGEVSRALQLANRRRLEERQADGWAERDALRQAQQAQALVGNPASRRAKNDPWKGAVPEFEPVPESRVHLMGKRFKVAGAYWQAGADNRLRVWTADREVSAEVYIPGGIEWYEVLPAGGDRLILLFYSYSDNKQYQEHENITDTGWTAGAPNVPPSSGGGIRHEGTARTRIVTTDRWRTATAQLTEYRYAFLVAKDQIKQLAGWPSGLRQLIERKYRIATGLKKIVTANNKVTARHEYAQTVRSYSIYKLNGAGVPNSVFAPGTGETIGVKPEYDTNGRPDPYGGGAWVPVVSPAGIPAAELYPYVHPQFDPNTMSSLGDPAGGTLGVQYLQGTYESITYSAGTSGEDYEVIFSQNTYQSPTLLQFGTDVLSKSVWYPLMRSYGYGYLANRDAAGQSPGWGNTPAVFSFLKNYEGEFHKEDGDTTMLTKGLSYRHALENYMPVDAPAYFLTTDVAIPDAEVDTTKTYYYFKAPPADADIAYDDPMAFRTDGKGLPVILKPNRGEYTTAVVQPTFSTSQRDLESGFKLWGNLEIPVAAWDWDRPLACWIELSRLGFTPEDLMLSETEAQALAAADWSVVGFKF